MANKETLQRVGTIGDIHGEAKNLKIALEFLSQANVDQIMSVGDIIDGKTPQDVIECLDLLQTYKVLTVSGNHERWIIKGQNMLLPDATHWQELNEKSQKFIKKLPATREFDTERGRLLLCHGLGSNDMVGVWPGDYGVALEYNLDLLRLTMEGLYKFVINGHTHARMVRAFDSVTIINAGTLVNKQSPCFLVADFTVGYVQFYDIRQDEVIEARKVAI